MYHDKYARHFFLSQKLPAIARQYIKEDMSPRVRNSFQKLSKGNLPLKSERILQDNVSGLGSCKPTSLTASQVIALESLTNRDVVNRSAVVYDRFVVNHVLYTSQNYTRAKRHRDDIVKIDHLSANYGRIMGLYTAKLVWRSEIVIVLRLYSYYCACSKCSPQSEHALQRSDFVIVLRL